MATEYTQNMAIVIDMDSLTAAIGGPGDGELNVTELLAHFRAERGVKRSIHRIHVVVGAERITPTVRDAFLKMRADIHFANKGRPDCLVFQHSHQMAEVHDVLALLVTNSGYLPLLRHVKGLGCRVELHALPNSDQALFPAADEVIGLLPPTHKVQAAKGSVPKFGMPLAA